MIAQHDACIGLRRPPINPLRSYSFTASYVPKENGRGTGIYQWILPQPDARIKSSIPALLEPADTSNLTPATMNTSYLFAVLAIFTAAVSPVLAAPTVEALSVRCDEKLGHSAHCD
jgi:hypothetical protein